MGNTILELEQSGLNIIPAENHDAWHQIMTDIRTEESIVKYSYAYIALNYVKMLEMDIPAAKIVEILNATISHDHRQYVADIILATTSKSAEFRASFNPNSTRS